MIAPELQRALDEVRRLVDKLSSPPSPNPDTTKTVRKCTGTVHVVTYRGRPVDTLSRDELIEGFTELIDMAADWYPDARIARAKDERYYLGRSTLDFQPNHWALRRLRERT